MPSVRVLSLDQVATILSGLDSEELLTSQAKAFQAYSANETQTPHRSTLQTPAHATLIMPSRIDSQTSVIKVVSVPKTDSKNGLPGVTLVMDNSTGEPRGLVNARLLTALRTAAGSALATRAVFTTKSGRDHRPLTLAVFGSGAQAKAHIQLLVHTVPQIAKVVICNRTLPRAQELIKELQSQYDGIDLCAFSTGTGETTGPQLNTPSAASDPKQQLQSIVQAADIICTCTNTREPLFRGEWVKPGAHINMVGSFTPEMHEVDQVLIQRAYTLVDARKECEEEAGELILAIKESGYDGIIAELGQLYDQKGSLQPDHLPSQLGALASFVSNASSTSSYVENGQEPMVTNKAAKSGSAATMVSHRDVTIFKSVGIAAQDVAITALVLDKAEVANVGSVVDI
ncbi:hypothetical protein BGZ70_006983 [Mortierella alpina]|uniref:Ornithine cyclodeaminase n=1 Tax=Mortierella alpina TaxID=64518 RepID=A0A9P6M3L5_MORAP|nr:hypothetical protein BGZ70_006983 [Mortierella alpina]